MRYIGFDVGDGESAIAAFEQGSGIEPAILPVGGSRSFLSAVGMLNGEIEPEKVAEDTQKAYEENY